MPIKKDGTGKRWVEMEVLLPGTPEQVWDAVATGPGNAAWVTRAEIEPRAGGTFRLLFGDGAASSGEVTMWDPPHRFGYDERDWQEDAPPVATEITITARSGNECILRMVHSLLSSSDEWDAQMEAFESGWPGFFAILSVYLEHFAGEAAASFILMEPAAEDSLSTWKRLVDVLGLTGANVGERRTTSSGPDPWTGTVEQVSQDARQRWVLLRLDRPSSGVALVGTSDAANMGGAGTNVSICRYFYGDEAVSSAAETERRWREWLTETFDTKEVENF